MYNSNFTFISREMLNACTTQINKPIMGLIFIQFPEFIQQNYSNHAEERSNCRICER